MKMRMNQIMKQCSECGELLPLTNFHKNGHDKHGMPRLRAECRTCYKVKRKLNKKRFNKFKNNSKHRDKGKVPEYELIDWKHALINWKGECAYCGRVAGHGKHLTKDHVVAVSKGGKTTRTNIIPSCERCNFSKGNKELVDWYHAQEFYSKKRLDKILRWCKTDG